MLVTCQAGFESLLARELIELHGRSVIERGAGWVRLNDGEYSSLVADSLPLPNAPLAFAHLTWVSPVELRGESVNALALSIGEFFLSSLRAERIESAWPNVWVGPREIVGLGRRITAVEDAFAELL